MHGIVGTRDRAAWLMAIVFKPRLGQGQAVLILSSSEGPLPYICIQDTSGFVPAVNSTAVNVRDSD